MSGRGRGRPPSRLAQEPAAGPSRRSTRQQQNNAAPPEQEAQPPQEQQQEEQDQLQGLVPGPRYHEIIDPAITGSQDGSMPPPPVPSAKGLRGQVPQVARRGTRRDARASSMASINSLAVTDAYSSQAEPQSTSVLCPGLTFTLPRLTRSSRSCPRARFRHACACYIDHFWAR